MLHLPDEVTISYRDTVRAVTNTRSIMANVNVVGSIVAAKFVRGAKVRTFRAGSADTASLNLRTRNAFSFVRGGSE